MQRLPVGAALALAVGASLAALGLAAPVLAHHGWSSFETQRAYYVSGTVTYVRWGNPHTEVRIRVDNTSLPADWSSRELPPDANESIGEATMASARPYGGEHDELQLVLASPEWMARWGLDRPLREGETLEVVGFLDSAESRDLRPVMFWLENGQGVWQQLTSFPYDPEPAASASD